MVVNKKKAPRLVAACAVMLTMMWAAAAAEQSYYPSPEGAVEALLEALECEDLDALKEILGSDVDELGSGDSVADEMERDRFLERANEAQRIQARADDQAELLVGPDQWPFAIPLVREAKGWRFDTAAGKEELINRRIGGNELHAIATVRAYVEAQYEYAARDPMGEGVRQYAQRLSSTEGRHDGLFWPVDDGEPESPLGPLVAQAVQEGYGKGYGKASPYHGYYYRILKAQGAQAHGGAHSYLEDGRMTEGFGLVAYPAEYGRSGIMTFIVNQRGLVFQKDLGENTDELAIAMTEYDPDSTWAPVAEY
jgi:hypothetical protein